LSFGDISDLVLFAVGAAGGVVFWLSYHAGSGGN